MPYEENIVSAFSDLFKIHEKNSKKLVAILIIRSQRELILVAVYWYLVELLLTKPNRYFNISIDIKITRNHFFFNEREDCVTNQKSFCEGG